MISTREHTLGDLLEGRVCSKCNNGWMSRLEQSARPHLHALMVSEEEVENLDNKKRLCIARWACKTTWLLNSASNYRQTVPAPHFRLVAGESGTLPANIIVLAAQHASDRTFSWLQSPTWIADVERANSKTIHTLASDSYKISLQLRDLLLLVAWWPEAYWRYGLQRRFHFPLWYEGDSVYWHSGNNWLDLGSEKALYGFHTELTVAEPGADYTNA